MQGMRVPSPIEVLHLMSGVSPARRGRRIGLALAGILALAACTPAPAPSPAPTASPAPTGAPTAAPSPSALPTPAPTPPATSGPTAAPSASAAGTTGAVAASPSVDRRAGARGTRICVVNATDASIGAAATAAVVDLGSVGSARVVDSATVPSGGAWCTHGYNDCTMANPDYAQDVCGFITLPSGAAVAYMAVNQWLGEPWLVFDAGADGRVEHRWSVGRRDTIVTGGYTVTGTRLADIPTDIVYELTISR